VFSHDLKTNAVCEYFVTLSNNKSVFAELTALFVVCDWSRESSKRFLDQSQTTHFAQFLPLLKK